MASRFEIFTPLAFVVLLASGCAAAAPLSSEPTTAPSDRPAPKPQIEIAIRDYTFLIVKMAAIRIGTPVEIIVRNEDAVTHGFVSPMLGEQAQGEGEGVTPVAGGFHVDPGKTLVVRVTPERPGGFSFHCDIHQAMKQETFYFDVRPARPQLK